MMTFYYSMKQMLRTPLRSILFFVLVGISALLLAVGGSLLYQSSGMEREFEKIYTTIATVEQKQEEVRTIPVWDETLQDYSYIGGNGMSAPTILNTDGEIYPVFDEREYEIVGIYTVSQSAEKDDSELGMYEVIIPWNTVPEEAWSENITGTGAGYMKSYNTSFQIPNGSIAEYMEGWKKQGIDGLEIKFYDNGYTELKEDLESRKMTSKIFLTGGLAMAFLILLFFANLFISGQQERIAVERLLGRTKRQCAVSVLSGMLVLAAAGIFCGSATGYVTAGMVGQQTETELKFDTTYSNAAVQAVQEEEEKEAREETGKAEATVESRKTVGEKKPLVSLAVGSGVILFILTVLVSAGYMKATLKKEVLQMLGESEEI